MKSIIGNKYGRLTVVALSGKIGGHNVYRCLCECGGIAIARKDNLISGHTNSCGCLQLERASIHNKSSSKLFKVWAGIINRCENENARQYKDYGGRGISICKEWRTNFQAFYDWAIENGYAYGLTVDRIDNDGNYCPENCRIASREEQANNTRRNVLIEYNGQRNSIAQWARRTGINEATLWNRLRNGWSVEKALTAPVHKRRVK